jgi:predicted patatin/cPLA2 family phospholipase
MEKKKIKRGLVVEGGGMRGAHSCGALMALVEKGIKDFDVISASSAGACTSAFVVSRQFDLFPVVWTNYLHDGRFINLKKLVTRKSVMNLDFLVDEVFQTLAPLDLEAIRKSPTNFYIAATDCNTGKTVYFNNHTGPLFEALKASAAMPIAYRGPVMIHGQPYVDGGISAPIPIQKAIDEGCDEVYVILTRPKGYRKKPNFLNLIPRIYQKKYPKLAETLSRRHLIYNEAVERIENQDYPAKLIVIQPSEKLPVNRLSTNLEKIRAAIAQGRQDSLLALSR